MSTDALAGQLLASKDFFERSSGVLDESHSGFRPREGMMTAAQQVAHTAHTLGWFVDGVMRPEGFDLDFERQARDVAAVASLAEARRMLDAAFARALQWVRSSSAEDLARPLPPPIMAGQPAGDIVWAMVEHTAHHRGSLAVYSRLLGLVPPMPYGG